MFYASGGLNKFGIAPLSSRLQISFGILKLLYIKNFDLCWAFAGLLYMCSRVVRRKSWCSGERIMGFKIRSGTESSPAASEAMGFGSAPQYL